MFAKARFMSNVSECGKPERKTRPYDNSKRIAKAADVDQRKSRTYKESALEPQRLISLKQDQMAHMGILTVDQLRFKRRNSHLPNVSKHFRPLNIVKLN